VNGDLAIRTDRHAMHEALLIEREATDVPGCSTCAFSQPGQVRKDRVAAPKAIGHVAAFNDVTPRRPLR
jgi:hypothetical protein